VNLFEAQKNPQTQIRTKHVPPLAERMRPRSLNEFVGHTQLTRVGAPFQKALENDSCFSMILYGPPGSGKTSIFEIIRNQTTHPTISLSAVTANLKDLRAAFDQATKNLTSHGKATVLFLDEIHRFNKAQQDALLPFVERGIVILVGATTENPSFEVNSSLLSRCRVIRLEPLEKSALIDLLGKAIRDPKRGLGLTPSQSTAETETEALDFIAQFSHGDARRALNLLELSSQIGKGKLSVQLCKETLQRGHIRYDKTGEEHYNTASALIKSLRGSDPNAALYYLARMIEGGEDPNFIARRLVIFASEDIGNADPHALSLAVSCQQATHFVGLPECQYHLAQTTIYLALSPKSNASGKAYFAALKETRETGNLEIPMHLRNPVTKWMKHEGYGKNYDYPHEHPFGLTNQTYLPTELQNHTYYHPTRNGYEETLRKRLSQIDEYRQTLKK